MSKRNIIISAIMYLASCGTWCMANGSSDLARSIEDMETEFNRTVGCVRGGLPMEIQFSLPDNPRKAVGEKLTVEIVDTLLKQLDGRLRVLLSQSANAVLGKSEPNEGAVDWSAGSTRTLLDEFLDEVAKRAPGTLGLSYCGSQDEVANASVAAILDYFGRALTFDEGRPQWVADLNDPASGQLMLMFAVGVRASGIELDPELLTK